MCMYVRGSTTSPEIHRRYLVGYSSEMRDEHPVPLDRWLVLHTSSRYLTIMPSDAMEPLGT